MSMSEWAKREIEILKSKNKPEEVEDFDYVGACCDSAMRAFESLMNDGHSGMSISITKDILMKLIDGKALTPIEDTPDVWGEPDKWGGKTTYQCQRMSSLFKEVYDDGRVEYTDVNRYYAIPIDNPECTYTGDGLCKILDEMFPITMPYIPKQGKYKFYTDDFLHDEGNGDYDCKAIYHVITPEGDKVDLNMFYYYPKNGETVKLTKEEYEKMKAERVKP